MKTKLMIGLLIVLSAALIFAQSGREWENAKGSIKKVGADWYAIVPDENPNTRFQPDNLPEEFQKDALRVVFSGTEQEIPAAGRRWGTPLKLKSIKKLEE